MAKGIRRPLSLALCFCFVLQQAAFCQVPLDISRGLSRPDQFSFAGMYRPPHLRALEFDRVSGDFRALLDKGDEKGENPAETGAKPLLEYFSIGLTLPNNVFWVNLRPDSRDNVIDPELARTDIGRILLEADVQLKKDLARFTSPETPDGRQYWDRLYKRAEELFGNDKIEIPTLVRPWIVPGEIVVRESGNHAYILKAGLKVMLEQDRLQGSESYSFSDPRLRTLNAFAAGLIKESIIPRLAKEVNTARRYSALRQVYYSLILAQWFKARFRGAPGAYARLIDRKDLTGLTSRSAWSQESYYQAYQKSFRDGEYNIRQAVVKGSGQSVRTYSSGGIALALPAVSAPARGSVGTATQGATTVYVAGGSARVIPQMESVSVNAAGEEIAARAMPDGGKPVRPQVIVLGGPDGVIIPFDKFRKSRLGDSIMFAPVVKMLGEGYRVVLISNQRYYDASGDEGIESRVMAFIPASLRHLITVYSTSGAFKVTFDAAGKPEIDNDFNNSTYIEPAVENAAAERIQKVLDEYWASVQSDPSFWRNTYPGFVFEKPAFILRKDANGRLFSFTIKGLPSSALEVHNLARGEKSARTQVMEKIELAMRNYNVMFWTRYTIREAGGTSIDIRKRYTGKDHALEDYMLNNGVAPSDVILLANLDPAVSEDLPFANVPDILRLTNDVKPQAQEGFMHIGKGLGSVYYIINGIAQGVPVKELLDIEQWSGTLVGHPSLTAAIDHLRGLKAEGFDAKTAGEKLQILNGIYNQFDLAHVDYPAWTVLYMEGMGITADSTVTGLRLQAALNELVAAYQENSSADDYFAAADRLFVKYFKTGHEGEFLKFFSAVDPRAARTVQFLAGVYTEKLGKSVPDLVNDILKNTEYTKLTIARVLSGYFQDNHYLRYREVMSEGTNTRAPPRIVYLGGGGKATTTFLQTLIGRGLKKLACIISSSDDGGSSWNIMASLFGKLGVYFIPPGDAAGLAIFLSNDNFKIFTLFWTESEKKMPEWFTSKGRVFSENNSLSEVWAKRISETLQAIEDPAKKAQLEAILPGKAQLSRPGDDIVFMSSMLNLAEFLDRTLFDRSILRLDERDASGKKKESSSANLMLIGAAYDAGLISEETGINPAELPAIEKLLGLGDTQFIPVSWDYEHSSLVADYQNGGSVRSQTLITDKGHEDFIVSESFHHRVGTSEERSEKDFVPVPQTDMPRPTEQSLTAMKDTDLVIMGNGSLWTSLMPVLLYPEMAQSLLQKRAQGVPVVYVAKIKADLETSKGVRVAEREGKFFLDIEGQTTLGTQLEAIRLHISKAAGRDVALNEIFSHVIIPELSAEAIEGLKVVPLDQKDAAGLSTALKEGQAQVSKYVKGVQPLFGPGEREAVEAAGIKVVTVAEEHVKGVADKSPLYENDYLVDVVEGMLNDSATARRDGGRRTGTGAQGAEGKGGIDFTALPIRTERMLASLDPASLARLSAMDTEKEWENLSRMLKAGILPSGQRLKECVQASCVKARMEKDLDTALGCIALALRMEEEQDLRTDPVLLEVLTIVDSPDAG